MGVLNTGLARKSILKTSVNEDNQLVGTRKKNDISQSNVRYNVTFRDITLEQSFWDKGVMS